MHNYKVSVCLGIMYKKLVACNVVFNWNCKPVSIRIKE